MLDVSVWGRRSRPDTVVAFNVVACEVVYALARHRRADELETLATELPETDETLRGETLSAMARTRDVRFRDEILAHLRAVWDPALRDPSFEEAVKEELGRGLGTPFARVMHRHPPELPWRADAIERYLDTLEPSVVSALIGDETLAPYLRLLLVVRTNYFRPGYDDVLPVARKALAGLAKEEATPTLPACVADTEALLDRVEARLALPERERYRDILR
jgi:hypothetical protein